VQRFRLADAYMRAGQFDRAIPLLEDLTAEAPGNPTFYSKLKDAYESVKRYDDAIALVEQRMGARPAPSQMSEKARLLYLKGDEDAAFAAWDDAVALAPKRSSTYRVVYQALVDIRRFDQAIDVLLKARDALSQKAAFRTDLAYLYSLNGEPRQAMQEYVALLDEMPDRVNFVRARLRPFVERDDGLMASIEVLQQASRDAPLNRSYRELLGWLHMENDDYAAAFRVHRAIDRLEREEGRVLFQFAQQAADAEAYAIADTAYTTLLTQHPEATVAPDAYRGFGDLHQQWAEEVGERAVNADGDRIPAPHYEAAAEAYRTFLRQYPTHTAYPSVLQTLGHLQQDVFRNLGEAEQTLREVVSRYPESSAADEARYDLGRIALQRNDLSAARLSFSRLVERLRTGDLAEQARYELALLHFYQGEFDAALTRVEATNANTATDVANDAVELKVLLRLNKGPDSLNTPLRLFAESRLYGRQQRADAALSTLDTLLARYGRHTLADNARFDRAALLEQAGDTTAALEAYGELPMIHPRSPFADRSLFALATLHEDAGHLEDAVDAYNRLLETHPNSLLAGDARKRLRALWAQRG
jgi:tetratricopeptide (TPR) repeat protein